MNVPDSWYEPMIEKWWTEMWQFNCVGHSFNADTFTIFLIIATSLYNMTFGGKLFAGFDHFFDSLQVRPEQGKKKKEKEKEK